MALERRRVRGGESPEDSVDFDVALSILGIVPWFGMVIWLVRRDWHSSSEAGEIEDGEKDPRELLAGLRPSLSSDLRG